MIETSGRLLLSQILGARQVSTSACHSRLVCLFAPRRTFIFPQTWYWEALPAILHQARTLRHSVKYYLKSLYCSHMIKLSPTVSVGIHPPTLKVGYLKGWEIHWNTLVQWMLLWDSTNRILCLYKQPWLLKHVLNLTELWFCCWGKEKDIFWEIPWIWMSTFWFWLSALGTITATRLLELTTSTPNKKVLMSYLQHFTPPQSVTADQCNWQGREMSAGNTDIWSLALTFHTYSAVAGNRFADRNSDLCGWKANN